jgi:tetratricopeptide (TPR) repeat protein
LLSRIDGKTSWEALRHIGGLPPEEVDRSLERWAKDGLIVIETAAAVAPRSGGAGQASKDPLDPGLDLPLELQSRILEFEARLDRPYHQILDVDLAADAREIKRAYFRLSKLFHPDRYFRRNLGHYEQRLDRVFKKIAEAYELLSDPTTRAEIERSIGAGSGEGTHRGLGAGDRERVAPQIPAGHRVPSRLENLERLRRRFKLPKKLVAERQFKARQLYRSALVAAKGGRWLEAAGGMRLAIAFDPWNAEYKSGFAEIQADVHRARADELIERASDATAQAEALKLLEEALAYRPSDLSGTLRAAALCLDLNEVGRAREHAESACELAPDQVEGHVLLARAHRRAGQAAKAAEALNRALALDRNHPEAIAERKQQRRRRSL